EQDALKKRLKRTPQTQLNVGALLKKKEKLSDVGFIDALLGSAGLVVGPLQRTISESGVKTNVSSVVLGSACLAGLAYIGSVRLLHLPLVGLGFAAAAAWIPYAVLRVMRGKRMTKFEEQFPEAIDLLARALRAGQALTTGLSEVADVMRAPCGPVLGQLFDQPDFVLPLPDALKAHVELVPM